MTHSGLGLVVCRRLNTFLELKMENERLQQRVAQLRAQSQALDGTADSFFATSDNFGGLEIDSGRTNFEMGAGSSLMRDADDDGPRKKVSSLEQSGETCGADGGGARLALLSHYSQLKRTVAEQHVCVTCGRTDSPEWRKVRVPVMCSYSAPSASYVYRVEQGPMGPKTLCNACGLRWAKKARKNGDGEGEGDGAQNGGSSIVF